MQWFEEQRGILKFLSVITIGEIRRGVESVRPRDPRQANALEAWLESLKQEYQGRIFPVDSSTVERWGRMETSQPISPSDALIAATALEHGLTVVTRNVAHFQRSGVSIVNPFV